VPAAKKALERAGLTIADMDVIEINEAFASQVLACLRGLDVPFDDSRVNPNGGGDRDRPSARRVGAAHRADRRAPAAALGGRYALVAMCVGVGQGHRPRSSSGSDSRVIPGSPLAAARNDG